VFVEDLNVAGMLQGEGNARNKQDASWRGFIEMLEYKGDLYGTHVVQVTPAGTTTCGVWCRDGQTVVGAGTQVPELRIRSG